MGVFDNIKESIIKLFKENTTKYEKSNKWQEYKLGPTITHCNTCFKRQNKIYNKDNIPILPQHMNCLCYLQWIKRVSVGDATNLGVFGADYYISNYGVLPNYYITKEEAENLGWIP